jgi:SAM-dependent methyltransferase
VFSREVLPDAVLSDLYAGSKVTFSEYTDIIRRDYIGPLRPFLTRMNKESALEIGCSSGFFLEELLEEGFKEVFGCEPSVEAKEKAGPTVKNNIYSGFFKRGIYKDNSFDLVCSFQTLDHLSDPVEVVKICHDILKPGGLAFFIVHDVNGLPARILRDKSPIIDIEHIYLFNRQTLKRIFEENGFNILEISDLKNSYPLGYWLKMFVKNNPAGLFGLRIIEMLKINKIAFPIAAGNIYIIASAQ